MTNPSPSPFNWRGQPSSIARELEESRQKSVRQTMQNIDGRVKAIVYSRAGTLNP